ncbi:MAG TPA: MATE family efflux transporter [Cellvibrionaceae bacterium]
MSAPHLSSRQLLLLALPVAVQMLMQSALGIVDVIMVSPLGATALAAVGLAAKLHFLTLVLQSGIATGCSVLIAQYLGAKDMDNCRSILAAALWVGLGFSLPFTLACAFWADEWMPLINPDAEVCRLAAQFMTVTALALLFTQLIVIYEGALRAQSQTGLPMLAAAVSIATNCVLNYGLIFGEWGLPKLGVLGAAWGTMLARSVQLILIMGWVYLRPSGFDLHFRQLLHACHPQRLSAFLKFSAPLMANYTLWGFGNTCYHALTGFAGTHALAAMAVMVPIESSVFALFVGLASASAVLVGRSLGGDDFARAWYLHQYFDKLTLGLLILICTALWLFRAPLLTLFAPSPEVAEVLMHTIGLFCILVWIKIFNMIRIIGILRAGGDNHFCLVTDTLVMWGVGLPVFALCVFIWPQSFLVLYCLMFLEDALKFLPVWHRIYRRRWLHNLTTAKRA